MYVYIGLEYKRMTLKLVKIDVLWPNIYIYIYIYIYTYIYICIITPVL